MHLRQQIVSLLKRPNVGLVGVDYNHAVFVLRVNHHRQAASEQ
jgi:hypothetical protein